LDNVKRNFFKSVEVYRPSVEVWTPVADMFFDNHSSNYYIYILKNILNITFFDIVQVVVLDGLLYVLGNTRSTNILTIQKYNPNTNTWKLTGMKKKHM